MKRILVVEDDHSSAAFLGEVLTGIGYEHFVVSSGKQAMEALERGGDQIALVISDLQLPSMDGLELARFIQEVYGKRFPVILTSACGHYEAAKLAGLNGDIIFTCLPKPLYPQVLLVEIPKVLGEATL